MTDGADTKPHTLILGASSGIGFEIATRLSKTHNISAIARRSDRLDALAPLGVVGIQCDLNDLDSVGPAIESAVATKGKFDAMVYCAGMQQIKALRTLKTEDVLNILNVNLVAAIVCARYFASPKNSTPEAKFCAISSIAGQRPEPGIVSYSVAKAGLDALIKGIARECAPKRAFGIAPGWLDTEMTRAFPNIYSEEFRAKLEQSAPRGIATVSAVAELAIYLLSNQAEHLTGQIITLDGGASL